MDCSLAKDATVNDLFLQPLALLFRAVDLFQLEQGQFFVDTLLVLAKIKSSIVA